jgi:hypothetical protein
MLKIGFDIGGVLSKYPSIFKEFIACLKDAELYVITDMHGKEEVLEILRLNGIQIPEDHVYCADYTTYGEMCKAVLIKELGIHIFFDDFVGYLNWDSSLGPAPVRLLTMPDPWKPYWCDEWKTTKNQDFGRRRYFKK